MSNALLIIIIIGYLGLLFIVAYFAERHEKSVWVNNPYVYVLSLAVYCSAWTYYGSVGVAASTGIDFLTIYLGPVIAAPLWILILRKILRIAKHQNISSIADFISLRYGNNRFLGALVTLICVLGIVPYIALQIKAISETYEIMSASSQANRLGLIGDSTFYVVVLIALFVAFFGTRATDATQRRKGIMTTIALESILKLLFFLIGGVYITYFLFDGTSDLYQQASQLSNFEQLTTFHTNQSALNWFFTIALSFFAIFLLPRQFHVTVVENERERYLKKAIWLFPLYLLLFNIFVIFIAWAGNIRLPDAINKDYYTLLLPLQAQNISMAVLIFLGGLSAVISMVVVSSLSLSTMLSNNLIIPYGFLEKFSKGLPEKNTIIIKYIRRIAIFSLIVLAYFFYVFLSYELSLYSIGLISFVLIAQLAPSFFLGLFWNRGTARAAIIGMIVGVITVFFTLIWPFTLGVLGGRETLLNFGYLGISHLKPYALFGIDFMNPETHSFFWSIFLNLGTFYGISLYSQANYRERNYAEIFVNILNYNGLQEQAYVWKGEAFVSDIKEMLTRFLGKARTERALKLFNNKYNISHEALQADARLISFSEKLLTGTIGSASAKILIANVTKEQAVGTVELLKILEEAKATLERNKALKLKSDELTELTQALKEANNHLKDADKKKDEFLETVAHELKTPITSIKAASEILEEEPDMPSVARSQFLANIVKDTQRLSTLINNILDLEKLSRGPQELTLKKTNITALSSRVLDSFKVIAEKNQIQLDFISDKSYYLYLDEDRIFQVLVNLISNSLKFIPEENGCVSLALYEEEQAIFCSVTDNGRGVPKADQPFIFEKFYQSNNQNIIKPQGSGFGLAICKKIIESHGGTIWLDSTFNQGAKFVFKIPYTNE